MMKAEGRINPGSGFLCIDATQRIAYHFSVPLYHCISLYITSLYHCITVYHCISLYITGVYTVCIQQHHSAYNCITV